MVEQTAIAKLIDTAADEAQFDDCVKKLLSNRLVLAWIMKECVDEYTIAGCFTLRRYENGREEGNT